MVRKQRYGIVAKGPHKGDLTECKAQDKEHCPYHVPNSHEDLTPEEAAAKQEKISEGKSKNNDFSLNKKKLPRPAIISTKPNTIDEAYDSLKRGSYIIDKYFEDDEYCMKTGDECYHHPNGYMSAYTFNKAFPTNIEKDRYMLLNNIDPNSQLAKDALDHWNDEEWMSNAAAKSVENDDAEVYYTDFPEGYNDDKYDDDPYEEDESLPDGVEPSDYLGSLRKTLLKPVETPENLATEEELASIRESLLKNAVTEESKQKPTRKREPKPIKPIDDIILSPAINDNNGYMGGHRFQGGRYEYTKDLPLKEVSKMLRSDMKTLKDNGYVPKGWKISVRQDNGSWSSGFKVTVKPDADSYKEPTWNDVITGNAPHLRNDMYYDGMLSNEDKFNEYMSKLTPQKKRYYKILKEDAKKAYDLIEDASNQYGYSDTNGMVDYFDYHRTATVTMDNENK